MLKELYDYAIRHDLILPAGYVKKTVKAYISLSSEASDYVGVRMADEDEVLAYPDIGSLANGTEKSNVLIEKRSVVLPNEPTAKSAFFKNALYACGETDPVIRHCAEALENAELVAQINAELDRLKVKPADRISFTVDGKPIVLRDSVLDWWRGFRKQFVLEDSISKVPCLITGELTVPMKTAPKITGLRVVGGHSSGDALICFDKAAFSSYNLDQAANAPVSEEAMSAVKMALDDLLSRAPRISGVKFVHWYDSDEKQRIRQAKLGCAPAHKLFELVSVKKKDEVEYPRSYLDYTAKVYLSKAPSGVQIGFLSDPYGEISWNELPADETWFSRG